MTPMRGPRCLLLSLLLLGGMLLTPRPARAGGVEPCEYASVFPGAALNVLVLPYRYEAPRGGDGGVAVAVPPELELASRQLAALVHLETLMSLLKYGSVGAKNLLAEPSQLCDVERVLARIGRPGESGGAPAPGALRGGQAVLLLWGRLFEQGGQLYLQSYLRFARQGPQGLADERLGFELGPGLPRLEAGLPVQALAFAPRRIGRQELARVDRDFRQAMLLRKEPRADAPGRSIDFSPHEAFAYWITAARGDWMQLQPMAGGPAGWVQVRGEATPDWSLQRWLPELAYVDAVAGFMRLRTSQQPVTVAERQRMLRAIETGLARYEQALAAELAPQPWGLAAALRGWLAWERREREAAVAQFERSRELMPDYAGARQLAALARAAAAAPLDRQAGERLTRELMAALALAPERPELLGNLVRLLGFFASAAGADRSPYEPALLDERLRILRAAAER